MAVRTKPVIVDFPMLGKPFEIPAFIPCNGGVLRCKGVNRYARALYAGKIGKAYVYLGFVPLSSKVGEELDIFIAKTKAQLDDEGYIDPWTGTEGKFRIAEIPDWVSNGINSMIKRGYL